MGQNSVSPSSGSFENPNSLLRATAAVLVLLLSLTRFIHNNLLWVEEAYPMAAAAEALRGKALYRDIWFDKPPLYALVYTLWGNRPGWPMRLAGALFVCICCYLAWRFAREAGGELAGSLAAVLLAIHLVFDIPASVMALAPDLLTLPLHIAAVYLAWRRRAFASGLCAGITLLFNGKGFFIAVACLLWTPRLAFLAGFVLPNLLAVAMLASMGSLGAYWRQVWVWGMRYSSDTFLTSPLREGFFRTLNWLGFHATIAIGLLAWFWKQFSWRWLGWLIVSFAAVCAGWRFFPRYYFHLLPVFVVAGACGLAGMRRGWRVAALCLALIPVARFGPRYVSLLRGDVGWSDLALMQDSRAAAAIVREIARPGDRLLVWGYRPDIFVFSGVPAATPYLDSQPITGVLADRHLTGSSPSASDLTRGNLAAVARARPEIIVDGLGALNPVLAVNQYPGLDLDNYVLAGRTRFSVIYVTKR